MENAPDSTVMPSYSPAKAALGLMVADVRFLLKDSTTPFFDQAVQFDENEKQIEPTNRDQVFLKKDSFAAGSKAAHWDVMTKNAKGEDVRLVMGGPLCMSGSALINRFGNYGIPMQHTPVNESDASFWFEVADQSYYEEGQNEHVLEFYSWWKRMRLWGFKTALEDSKFTIPWKTTLEKYQKPCKQWTMAEWISNAEAEEVKFAPFTRGSNGEATVRMESKIFFESKAQTGEKRKITARAVIPEIAAIEEKYSVSYNNLPIFRYPRELPKTKGEVVPMIELSDKEKWSGAYFGPHVVYWPHFTAQFSDNGKGVVNLKVRLNRLVVMGRAKNPLPATFGQRVHAKVDTESEAYKDFVRKQAEAEAQEAFQND